MEQLLDAGRVDINWADPRTGNTALHMASANGHAACVDLLLRGGADPRAANARGNTALHWAAENRRADAVDRLLRADGADVLRRNAFGKGALTLAFQAGDEDIAAKVAGPPASRRAGQNRRPGTVAGPTVWSSGQPCATSMNRRGRRALLGG